MTSPYGTTSPCAEIAKALNRPQAVIDWVMEWMLWDAGLRAEPPYHTKLYLPIDTVITDLDPIYRAVGQVIVDIQDDAARRRAEAAA